ncbi:MAG TPA: DUF2652 domain-containing protein [Flavisolibacter sp.]|nr:DUF2652 domain-containing protein [Flavisolibacter sp.]
MATQLVSNTVQPALLFMPDISGFTEFVTNTEIEHAQSIIQEVLELLIESNKLDLKVSEIEGDAIFFYKIGNPPSYTALLEQIQFMFTQFHRHLRLYDLVRICPCAACSSAIQLKLKIIAHFGEVSNYSVQQYNKLFGKDLITLHRLLKNSLNKKEYALLTTPLVSSCSEADHLPGWYKAQSGSEAYDTGAIDFIDVDLSELLAALPEQNPPSSMLSDKTKIAYRLQREIPASPGMIFGEIFTLSERAKWMHGVKKIEMITKDHVNRIGTKHRCFVDPRNNPVIVTDYATVNDNVAELVEMNENGLGGCRYRVEKIEEHKTRLSIELLVNKNPFITSFFNLFMKKKLMRSLNLSADNLYSLCTASEGNPQSG